jgi:serine/threonine-protein kinase HipA
MMMSDVGVLDVRLYGQPIGTLTRFPGDQVLFAFNEAYISDQNRPTLSLSFKDIRGGLITDVRTTQTRLPPFFANLLPEPGPMRDLLAARANIRPQREFFLIAVLGRDLPGALQIQPAGSMPPEDASVVMEQSTENSQSPAPLRFSLAGVQLKFSAVQGAAGGLTVPADGVGGSWIVKLPSSRYPDVPENEFAMMELARRVGIAVPETRLIPINEISGIPSETTSLGERAFVIRRFDRSAPGELIHIEDFAQVFGVYPEEKYGRPGQRASYRNIADVLRAETGEPGVSEFIRRLVFNILIGNADMHLKNWSLIYQNRRRPELSPAYDFVSTIAYIPDDKLALTFVDSKEFASVTAEQFERFAMKARLPARLTLSVVRETVARFADAWEAFDSSSIPERVREAIQAHLATVPIWSEMRRPARL